MYVQVETDTHSQNAVVKKKPYVRALLDMIRAFSVLMHHTLQFNEDNNSWLCVWNKTQIQDSEKEENP